MFTNAKRWCTRKGVAKHLDRRQLATRPWLEASAPHTPTTPIEVSEDDVRAALAKYGGNKTRAAKSRGTNRWALGASDAEVWRERR
jgi:hypothetical protein